MSGDEPDCRKSFARREVASVCRNDMLDTLASWVAGLCCDKRRRTTRERVLCVITPDEEDGVARLPRDQLLPPACASWRFRAGDNLTIIAFLNRKDSIEDSSALLHAAWVPVVSFDNSDHVLLVTQAQLLRF